MKRENGVYNFNLWIHKPPGDNAGRGTIGTKNRFDALRRTEEEGEQDFSRQGEDTA